MKLRNVKVAKRLGTKTLAGLLAFGLIVGTPSVVLADVQSTMSQSEALWNRSISVSYTHLSDRSAGVAIAWNPEGYRSVKHVLVKFNDEQAALYAYLQSQLDSLNAEKEAIENPAETEEASAETEEAPEVTPEPTPEPRSIEAINADIAACATEIEALYAQLMPTAEDVIAAFDGGTSFDELIEKYNEDPGMQSEPTASAGYAVAAVSYTHLSESPAYSAAWVKDMPS